MNNISQMKSQILPENPKIILVVQGRLGSSRLPKKAIYPLGSKTVLHQVLKNLLACDVNDYFLATDFNSAKDFNQDISEWNVGNVAYMEFMFCGATSFDQEIGHWDVSSVTTMEGMFKDAKDFNADISYWDVSNVTDMSFMFSGATSFDQNLLSWRPRKYGVYTKDMFHNCPQDDYTKPNFY